MDKNYTQEEVIINDPNVAGEALHDFADYPFVSTSWLPAPAVT